MLNRYCIGGPNHGKVQSFPPPGYKPEEMTLQSDGITATLYLYAYMGDPGVERLLERLAAYTASAAQAAPAQAKKAKKVRRRKA